jgi:hypothetical protein
MHGRIAARPTGLQLIKATALVFGVLLACAHPANAQQAPPNRFAVNATADTQQVQHAIEHSDAYYTRLTIHRIGSYAMLPLFAGEFYLGQKLINGGDYASWIKPTHSVVAGTIGGLFAVNTVTGLWNLYDARKDENPTRRYLHSALMLAADAGFVYTAAIAGDAKHNDDDAGRHRNAALFSFGSATAGTLLMWLWKDDSN